MRISRNLRCRSVRGGKRPHRGHLLISYIAATVVTLLHLKLKGRGLGAMESLASLNFLKCTRFAGRIAVNPLEKPASDAFKAAGIECPRALPVAGGKLCYGPVWDFDYHTFTLYEDASQGGSRRRNSRLNQWELLTMDSKGGNKYYFADLVKYDPEFRSLLLERWNEYKVIWKNGFSDYVDMMADSIRLSEGVNKKIWPYGGYIDVNSSYLHYKQNGDWDLSFQEAVDAIKTAFNDRWTWIDNNLKTLGR